MTKLRWTSILQIATSVILLLTAPLDIFDTVVRDVTGLHITVAHGLFVFAVGKLIKETLEVREDLAGTRESIAMVRERGQVEERPVGDAPAA